MKKVTYRVTTPFGFLAEGEEIEAILLTKDEDSGIALLFHPARRGECNSVELAEERLDGAYESLSENGYVNLPSLKAFKKTVSKI